GSDVAGATAAALALGALVFEDQGDSAYSKQLLASATSLYKFAVAHRGPYQTGIYTSDKDTDELCLAAVWLYRATHLVEYLNAAKNFVSHDSSWGLTLESKDLSCQQLLFEETQDSTYRRSITDYFNKWLPGGTVQYTPCGLAWRMKWGPLGTAAKSAFLALLAADSGIEQDRYRKWAVEQINYILGDNPHNGGCFSFEVGYSSKYPLQPDHRAASCPDRPAPCGHEQSSSTEPNPQILTGAIVGGPDEYDQYVDSRPDWVHNEVQVDYNAGFQAALAGIVHLQNVNLDGLKSLLKGRTQKSPQGTDSKVSSRDGLKSLLKGRTQKSPQGTDSKVSSRDGLKSLLKGRTQKSPQGTDSKVSSRDGLKSLLKGRTQKSPQGTDSKVSSRDGLKSLLKGRTQKSPQGTDSKVSSRDGLKSLLKGRTQKSPQGTDSKVSSRDGLKSLLKGRTQKSPQGTDTTYTTRIKN
ncbi:endoglucanase, partial [Biomphalaria glabrata]